MVVLLVPGAFISPKIGKFSPLYILLQMRLLQFSTRVLFRKFFKIFLSKQDIIRIPSSMIMMPKKFIEYEKANTSKRKWITKEELKALNINEKNRSLTLLKLEFVMPQASVMLFVERDRV